MKIAQILGYAQAFNPSNVYGITGMAYDLCETLTKLGHEVVVFAPKGTKTSAKLRQNAPLPANSYQNKYGPDVIAAIYSLYRAETLSMIRDGKFDLVHNHWAHYAPFLNLTNTPHITTLHGDGHSFIETKVQKMFPKIPFVGLSKNAIKKSGKFKFVGQVYNGINLSKFKYNSAPKKHLVWLGRLDPEKGAHLAIQAAKKCKVSLRIGGIADTEPRKKYLNKYIKPHLKSKYITFVGEVARKDRSNFLNQAIAFLNPIQWEEPFGLVMIEAMACGTPVISFKRGSASEVVKHNKTGYLVNNVNQMVQAIRKIDQIKRQDCLQWVENKFTTEKMAREYVKIYKKMIKKYKG